MNPKRFNHIRFSLFGQTHTLVLCADCGCTLDECDCFGTPEQAEPESEDVIYIRRDVDDFVEFVDPFDDGRADDAHDER